MTWVLNKTCIMFNSKLICFSIKHHDSRIHIELILSPSYVMTRASKTKQNETNKTEVRATQGGRKTGRGTGQNKDVYKYTTNLQIALMFKDPLTSGSDWEGSPSSAVFYDIHVCTKHINTYTKLIENGGKHLSKQCKMRRNKNSIAITSKAGKSVPIIVL